MSLSGRSSWVHVSGREDESQSLSSSQTSGSGSSSSTEASANNMSYTTRLRRLSTAASLHRENVSYHSQPLERGQSYISNSDSSSRDQSSFSSTTASRTPKPQSLLVKLKMPPPPRTRQMEDMSNDSAPTSNAQSRSRSRQSHNIFADPVIINGPRNSRNKRPIVEVDSDEDDDLDEEEDGEDDDEEEDANGEYVDDEGDEEDDDGDVDMDDAPPVSSRGKSGRQILKLKNSRAPTATTAQSQIRPERNGHADTGRKTIKQQPARSRNRSKYVEEEDDGDSQDNDGLSSLASDEVEGDDDENDDDDEEEEDDEEEDEEEEDIGNETVNAGEDDDEANEIDADGEPDDANTPVGAASSSDEDDDDDDDETISTDPSRLTKRQRGNLGTDFLQLPMEPQIKKHLTEEEHAMRRAEMARRRKNLSEKRNEEEKMDVINKLLRKQAPRKRGRVSTAGTAAAIEDEKVEAAEEEQVINKEFPPKETMIRYVWGKDGCKLGVPQRWIDAGAGGSVIINQKVEPLS